MIKRLDELTNPLDQCLELNVTLLLTRFIIKRSNSTVSYPTRSDQRTGEPKRDFSKKQFCFEKRAREWSFLFDKFIAQIFCFQTKQKRRFREQLWTLCLRAFSWSEQKQFCFRRFALWMFTIRQALSTCALLSLAENQQLPKQTDVPRKRFQRFCTVKRSPKDRRW